VSYLLKLSLSWTLWIVVFAVLVGTGCAPKTALQGSSEPLTPFPVAPREGQLRPRAEAAYHYLLSQDEERHGDAEQARNALARAFDLDPTPFLGLELANAFWQAGQTAQARTVLKQTLDIFPQEPMLISTLINTYLAEDLVDEALVTMEQYLAEHPQDWETREDFANLLLQRERFSSAADMLAPLPDSERTPEVLLLMAKSSAGLGLTRQSEEYLSQALEIKPDFLEALAELAFLYESEGDLVRADEIYARILDLRPDAEEILLRLIQVNVKLNQPQKALSFALGQPVRETFLLEAALIFINEDLFAEAGMLLDAVPAEDGPLEAEFYRALVAYEGNNDPEQALIHLGRIPRDHPHFARALSFQGHILLHMERPEEALRVAQEGRQGFPNMSDFFLLEAEVLLELGQTDTASRLLQEARQKWPGDTDVLYRLGFLQEQMGQRRDAMRTMEEIVQLEPDHAEALNFIGYSLAEEDQDLERALVLVESALKIKPGSGHIIDSLAWVHFRMNNLDQAWKHIQSAVRIMPDDPTIWEHYGDIAAAKGLTEKARHGYEQALRFATGARDALQEKLEAL
jgi:tetratricopeptide (TPR) repeat protein